METGGGCCVVCGRVRQQDHGDPGSWEHQFLLEPHLTLPGFSPHHTALQGELNTTMITKNKHHPVMSSFLQTAGHSNTDAERQLN